MVGCHALCAGFEPSRTDRMNLQLMMKDARASLGGDGPGGASRSELVRHMVRSTFGREDKEERLAALRASAAHGAHAARPVPSTSMRGAAVT